MKKLFLLPLLMVMMTGGAWGQKASEANENFAKKESGNAITITCEGDPKNVEEVLKTKLKKVKGGGNVKGNTAHEGVVIEEFSPKTLDYYYRVDKAGENQSKIIFFVSFGNNNFLSSKDDPSVVANIKTSLENMVSEIKRFEIQLAIEAQEKVLAGAISDQEKLEKDLEKLQKEQIKLEEELAKCKENQVTNKSSQEAQKKQIEEEKKVLSELQTKLGSVK